MTRRITIMQICWGVATLFIDATAPVFGDDGKPPTIYIDKGACPHELCQYGEWIAKEEIPLLDSPNGKVTGTVLKAGEKVKALTGEVHSRPHLAIMKEQDPENPQLARGSKVYFLTYQGEGFWKVWFEGKTVISQEGCYKLEEMPKETPPWGNWWVSIETMNKKTGWAKHSQRFVDPRN